MGHGHDVELDAESYLIDDDNIRDDDTIDISERTIIYDWWCSQPMEEWAEEPPLLELQSFAGEIYSVLLQLAHP